jgi:transcriptional regulator with XRE-family HTH domain
MLLSTPPLHKLMVKGGADVREKKELNVRIGNQIRIARESAGLTQDRFAELVSLATKNVSDIERGVVGISIGTLIRICETLSISSDSILFEEGTGNDAHSISERLSNLPPEQFEIACNIINKLFEAFASSGK